MRSVDGYLTRGMGQVEGWLDPWSALVIAALGRKQTEDGLTGGVGEIGVHHGKLTILLHLLTQPEERTFAIDVFDMAEFNVDHSGRGDLDRFVGHLRRWGDMDRVDIIRANSPDVTPDRITSSVGSVRLMSIDGGHTTELTISDLQLGNAVIADNGIVILDDAFNYRWPGVMSGLVEHLESEMALVPVGLSPNKVYLARPGAVKTVRDYLSTVNVSGLIPQERKLFGHDIALLAPVEASTVRRSRLYGKLLSNSQVRSLYRWVEQTPVGPRLKRMLR